MFFAIKTLEFNLVLEEIAAFSHTKTTINNINNIRPLSSLNEITSSQNKVSEAILIISRSGDLPFLENFDIVEVLDLIKAKRDLTISDLQYLRLFLKMSADIKNRSTKFLKEHISLNFLNSYFGAIDGIFEIVDLIDSTIAADGSVLDSASETLYKLRKEIKRTEQKRDKVLMDLLSKKAKLLNDNILIMRNDRYCLPVKTDLKAQVKGITHDVSSSGTTTYIEPFEANELSNILVKLHKDADFEILKILREVSFLIFHHYEQLKINMDVLLDLDLYFSVAKYSIKYECHMPKTNTFGNINLINARHPLINQDEIVPVNITINEHKPVLMITGPNTGGKTVALKTLGLLSVMAQSGLLIPASPKSEVSVLSGVYADIGDHQSIKQSLSTFSSHIKNIKNIIDNAQEMSLILLDELGSGTDPNEGTSLAMSIVDYFLKKNVRLVLTTHYSELKIYAYESPFIINASVKFNDKTLEPLYEIEYGKSGSSNALKIAKRLGINAEIIDQASNYLEQKNTDLSVSVEKFEERIEHLNERISNVEKIETNIKEKEKELDEKILKLELEKEKMFLNAQKEVKKQVDKITEEARVILSKLEDSPKEHEIALIKGELKKLGIQREKTTTVKNLNIGDSVYITSYQQYGKVVDINKDVYLVKFGIFELEFSSSDLIKVEEMVEKKVLRKKRVESKGPTSKYASTQLDLRGFRYEDVEGAYKKFIDEALLANLKELRIIHGFGTGAVKKALYEELKKDKNVKSYRYGGEHEGMAGVTIVTIA